MIRSVIYEMNFARRCINFITLWIVHKNINTSVLKWRILIFMIVALHLKVKNQCKYYCQDHDNFLDPI